jgi:hypothetical protein
VKTKRGKGEASALPELPEDISDDTSSWSDSSEAADELLHGSTAVVPAQGELVRIRKDLDSVKQIINSGTVGTPGFSQVFVDLPKAPSVHLVFRAIPTFPPDQ